MADRTSEIAERAKVILDRRGIFANPYFRGLQDGTLTLEAFRRTQEQFYFAVAYFPRPMASLVSRIPDAAQRLDILRNLVEEHGDFAAARFHRNTFREFLRSIGADPEVHEQMAGPEVRAFNAALAGACAADDLETGIACMGVIEQAFAGISAIIGRVVVDRGWVAPEKLVHYKLHAEIDERHAGEFFAVVETGWHDGSRRDRIEQGLELGAYIFDRLYRDWNTTGSD